jgi:hypothetical protein
MMRLTMPWSSRAGAEGVVNEELRKNEKAREPRHVFK